MINKINIGGFKIMENFYAGLKGKVEILEPEKRTFSKNHEDMVEPLSIYFDGKHMAWRYRLNYMSTEENKYRDGLVIDFKNMPDDTRSKDAFTKEVESVVEEPWFQGRLGNIRADIAWMEMNSSYKKEKGTDKLEKYVAERLEENLEDITSRLCMLHRAFLKEARKENEESFESFKFKDVKTGSLKKKNDVSQQLTKGIDRQ